MFADDRMLFRQGEMKASQRAKDNRSVKEETWHHLGLTVDKCKFQRNIDHRTCCWTLD